MLAQTCADASTPLHIAVGNNQVKTVLVLLNEGSDANALNKEGSTPLHLCARVPNLAIAQALIAGGAKLGLQNSSKETPLSAARLHRNAQVAQFFEGISKRTVRRESLNALLKVHLPELAGEDDEDAEPPLEDPAEAERSKQESAVVQRISKETRAIQATVRRLEEAGWFKQLPALREGIERLQVPASMNLRLATFCEEIDRLYEKIQTLFKARGLKEPRPPEIPEEEAPAEEPLQKPCTLIPVNLFLKNVSCSLCGGGAITPCRDCGQQLCRICYYSTVHTCETKL
jgi:hypothetical protein